MVIWYKSVNNGVTNAFVGGGGIEAADIAQSCDVVCCCVLDLGIGLVRFANGIEAYWYAVSKFGNAL